MAVVGTADNLLRPALVGRDTQMSDLLIMLSTLGGLLLFGPVGLLIGPILAALFVTVWELYAEAFVDYLPDGRVGRPPDAEEPETQDAGVIESRDR
jgi:predicted PurR-regulated permease PerM